MTDKVEAPEESVSPAEEQVSANLSRQSSLDAELRKEVDELRSELRGLQGKQDKLQSANTQFEERLQKLGVSLTPEQQLQDRILQLEERIASVGATEAATPEARPKANSAGIDYHATFTELGIPATKENLQKALEFNNPVAMKNHFFVQAVNSGQPVASGSVASPQVGGSVSHSVSDLEKQYQAIMSSPGFNSPENQAKRKELIAEMQKLENS